MNTMQRRTVLAGFAGMLAAPAAADGWPEKPVVWIAPAAPGAPFDGFGRPVASHVAEALGRPIIIDNRSGAGGTIGIAAAARAPADGYTFLIGATSSTYLQAIYPNAGFDFTRDFVPITALARIQLVLAVNRERLNVSTLAEFIEAARRSPDSIEIASPGIGTVPHLAAELLQERSGITLHHVPYRDGGQLMQDLIAGRIAATWTSAGLISGHLKDGSIRVLATAGRRREALLPDVPTADEAGLKDFRAIAWFALFAPHGTPVAILDRLHGAVQETLRSDAIRQSWAEQGAKVELESRSDFARFVDQEVVRWNAIARSANIKLE